MNSTAYFFIGLAVGGIVFWFAGLLYGRHGASPADNRLEEELRQQVRQREQELGDARQHFNEASATVAATEAKREAAERLLAESREVHAQNLRAAKEAQDKALQDLREAFKALSADALKQSAPQFLQLANETLAKFQETA